MDINIPDWKKAGSLAAQALEFGKKKVKIGASLREVADSVEQKIRDLGGIPGFPCNVSRNSQAAHYSPAPDDNDVFTEKDVVKLDVGACFNGAIGDNAVTIDLTGKYSELAKAAEEARDAAVKLAKPGTQLREMGAIVEEAILKRGFQPVRNLSGHGIGLYVVHTKFSVPNYDNGDKRKLEENDTIAIEPFATTGKSGMIHEGTSAEIFKLKALKPVRDMTARAIIRDLEIYKGLPVAVRYLKYPLLKVNAAMRELQSKGMVHWYPVLLDNDNGIVSQAEHSVLVKDKPVILTKVD